MKYGDMKMDNDMTMWDNVPDNINDYHGFIYLIYNKVNGMKYIGKKKFWFKANKKMARKPNKTETLRLDRYKIINKQKYKDYKKLLHKKYIGKKKKVKGIIESDWRTYYGSCKRLDRDIEKYGYNAFKRVIIRCYKTEWECSYYELKLQIDKEVLFRKDYYNGIVQVRLGKQKRFVR